MRFFLSCLVVGLLAGCATAPSIPVGTKATDQIVIYNKQIPLPPGDWTVRGSSFGQARRAIEMAIPPVIGRLEVRRQARHRLRGSARPTLHFCDLSC